MSKRGRKRKDVVRAAQTTVSAPTHKVSCIHFKTPAFRILFGPGVLLYPQMFVRILRNKEKNSTLWK